MSRPIEIWRCRNTKRWHWRCHSCGLLRGGWHQTHPGALRRALNHVTEHR